jgi:hypothetical protein
MALRIQYKPIITMGWHPVTFRSLQTEEATMLFAERLATIHPEVRLLGPKKVVIREWKAEPVPCPLCGTLIPVVGHDRKFASCGDCKETP